jgi:hypothetical protein
MDDNTIFQVDVPEQGVHAKLGKKELLEWNERLSSTMRWLRC